MLELLQERVTLFADLVEATGRGGDDEGGNFKSSSSSSSCSSSSCRNLFRADSPYAPQAEPLLASSITEGGCVLLVADCCSRRQQSDLVLSHPVDRLTELLLDSNRQKQSVTNGNQELSSECPALASFASWLLQVVTGRRFSVELNPSKPRPDPTGLWSGSAGSEAPLWTTAVLTLATGPRAGQCAVTRRKP